MPVILASLLFDGSLVPLVSKWGFQQISWFVPAQWGFAASASTVDLRRVDALAANAADVDPLQRLVGVRHDHAVCSSARSRPVSSGTGCGRRDAKSATGHYIANSRN